MKMSQKKLEAASGISRSTISAIENDLSYNPTTKTLERLATALGTAVEQIFSADCAVNNTKGKGVRT